MKNIALFLILIFLVSACGSSPTPSATPDFQETAAALSATMVAETLTAMPTVTQIPTNTSVPTLPATPTETFTPKPPAFTLTPTVLATSTALPTETPWSGTLSPGNTEGLPTGLLRIENNTGVKEITITLTGVTLTRDQPIYMAYKVTGSLNLVILWARYKYIIQVPGKIIHTGTFTQNNKDKTTIRVYTNKIQIVGP